MVIKIKDKKIEKLLKEKGVLVDSGRKLTADIEKLEEKRAKLGMKIEKVKEQLREFAKNYKVDNFEKYEDIGDIGLVNGEVVINKIDYIEEYKKQLDEKLKESYGI